MKETDWHKTAIRKNEMKESKPPRDWLGRFDEGHQGLQKRWTSPDLMLTTGINYISKTIEEKKNPTISGLALALGFKSRMALLNYQKEKGYEEFHDVVSFLKLKIEEFLEERLLDHKNTNIAGLIFNLKNNYSWQDKSEISMNTRNMTLTGFQMINPYDEDQTD